VEPETTWHLEVINEMNKSTTCDDPFESDPDAFAEFMATLRRRELAHRRCSQSRSLNQNAVSGQLGGAKRHREK